MASTALRYLMVTQLALRVTLVALLLVGCGARSAETHDPNMVIAGWIAGPKGFIPYVTIDSPSTMIENQIYSPLIGLGSDLRPRWSASLSYKVDVTNGGKRYVLHLRRGAFWADGAPMDARDVVFTLELETNPALPSAPSGDFALMRSVRALNGYTVEVLLSKPSPPFLENALASDTLILPAHVLAKYPPASQAEAKFLIGNGSFSQHPLVGGPFRVMRNVADSYLILVPNPTYWGPKPHISKIAFRVYPEQDSLYAAADAGEIDVTDIPPNLWHVHDRLRGQHKFVTWPWNVIFRLVPNYHSPEIPWMRDVRVRQAFMYAIDREFIASGIMNGQANVLNGPVPAFSPYYDPHTHQYPYDPARARALLDAAGWHMQGSVRMKDGSTLRIVLKTGGATDAVASNVAQLVQANLQAVGIQCTLQNEEIQTFFSDYHASNFELALQGVILPPYTDDYKYYDTKETPSVGGSNYVYYSNPQLDRAMEAARVASSPAQARADLDRYQDLASEDVPVIFLYSMRLGAVVPPGLSGYDLYPLAPAALPMGLQFWQMNPSEAERRS